MAELPHISREGFRLLHTLGLAGLPNSLHLLSSVSCMHLTPAGLPSGIPGILDEIEGAMQQAAHPSLHSISTSFRLSLLFQSLLLLQGGMSQDIQIVPRPVKMWLEEEIHIGQILNRHLILNSQG